MQQQTTEQLAMFMKEIDTARSALEERNQRSDSLQNANTGLVKERDSLTVQLMT